MIAATVESGHLGSALIVGAGAVALLLTVMLGALGHSIVTLAHEGAHALAVVLLGGRVREVRLNELGGGGHTASDGIRGLADFLFTLVGYFGPSLLGLLLAVMLNETEPIATLWLTVLLLGLLLVAVRGITANLLILLVGAAFGVAIRYAGDDLQVFIAYTWTWFLLLGGVGGAFRLVTARRNRRAAGQRDTMSDAYRLRRLTWTPASLWVAVFIIGTTAALLLGARLLLGL
jgi:hypothetical protein